MVSPVRAVPLPAQRMTTRSQTKGTSGSKDGAVEQLQALVGNGRVPNYMKLVVELLVETRAEIKDANKRNAELMEEIRLLREENLALKQKIVSLESSKAVSKISFSDSNSVDIFEERERSRSIVLECVPESPAFTAAQRVAHDFACVNQLLDYLDVECRALAVYRMGKVDQGRPRLIKAVLPASKFQKQAVQRAPRLRFFRPNRGIFLRASLTLEERMRRHGDPVASAGPVADGTLRANQARGGSRPPGSLPSSNTCAASQVSTFPGNC